MSEPDYDARAEVEWADYLSGEEISEPAAEVGEEISELAAEVAELTEALRCAERQREALITLIRNVHGNLLDDRIDAALNEGK